MILWNVLAKDMATWWAGGTNCVVASSGRARKKRARQIRDNPALIRQLSRGRLLKQVACHRSAVPAMIAGRPPPDQTTAGVLKPSPPGPPHLQVPRPRRRPWPSTRHDSVMLPSVDVPHHPCCTQRHADDDVRTVIILLSCPHNIYTQ